MAVIHPQKDGQVGNPGFFSLSEITSLNQDSIKERNLNFVMENKLHL